MKVNGFKLVMAGAAAVIVAGSVSAAEVTLEPNAVRTYCITDPLYKRITAAHVNNAATPALDDDNDAGSVADAYPAAFRGTEVVWQVIGALGDTSQVGEGYCGYVGIPQTAIGARQNYANKIQDCVTVARFDVASAQYGSAKLHWEGTNLGVRLSVAVTKCDYNSAFAVDNEGTPGTPQNPDCIVDNDDFAGGAFASINDVQLRKADNNVGLLGGISDLDFGDLFPIRDIELNAAGVDAVNEAAGASVDGGSIVLMLRCADSSGANNGFSGGNDNALIIHDPAGLGFPGSTGTLSLTLDDGN